MITARRTSTSKSSNRIGIRRQGSFTDVEQFFLKALLLDGSCMLPEEPQQSKPKLEVIGDTSGKRLPALHPKKLDDNVLFQLPFAEAEINQSNKFGRHEKKILGLWQAHEDGAHPVIMHRRSTSGGIPPIPSQEILKRKASSSRFSNRDNNPPLHEILKRKSSSRFSNRDNPQDPDDSTRGSSIAPGSVKSDVEVRPCHERDDHSSWREEDGGFVHYDAWEVLKDEYAEDFGFDYKETIHTISATLAGNGESQSHVFRILGTSADDQSAQPHVLSPPLMDSLLNFVPDSISMGNYWMKFSLIRDGCSLYTLKQYIKATPNTILAIETTTGEVFGAFSSHIWRNHPTFFGYAPAFLWRMRHNRRTPCHSLFEQAQMESEIDYYPFSGMNDLVQVCDEDRLAIGGGSLVPEWEDSATSMLKGIDAEKLNQGQSFGFGICLDNDLLGGTTSPCGTFRNPCLVNNLSKGETFEIANLEVWTLTSAADVKSAEKIEMTKFFLQESVRSTNTSTSSVFSREYGATEEEFQQDFYRRVGYNEPTKHRRKGSFDFLFGGRR